jgi:hypothetical protein
MNNHNLGNLIRLFVSPIKNSLAAGNRKAFHNFLFLNFGNLAILAKKLVKNQYKPFITCCKIRFDFLAGELT